MSGHPSGNRRIGRGAQGGSVEPRGKLRVEALVSVARWVIAPSLHEFQARYPNISVRLGGSDRISHLLDNGIDCAIRGGHLEDSSQIARHVCDVHLGLYAARLTSKLLVR